MRSGPVRSGRGTCAAASLVFDRTRLKRNRSIGFKRVSGALQVLEMALETLGRCHEPAHGAERPRLFRGQHQRRLLQSR